MKDLIAKLKSDATCAMGALYMHIDAQAARIAELEAQIAAASKPADTDKLREAIRNIEPDEATVDSHDYGAGAYVEGFDHALQAADELIASTALQAPVREVPEPEPDMLWEADEPEDGVTGNSPKDFAENYAAAAVGRGETHDVEVLCCNRTHNRTMRVSVSADEDAENWLHWEWVDALPAAPVQQEAKP